ncbi:CU044_5270 family protein [Streptomyces sp. E5N91]|uniref:CU044_5270 family protein n=1 Tax=Streptomyces sp. E5N91 TaxID=1851996 RepID=UPI000EF5C974|nr:CU044_5270 family protein [Streptomyces sp. E5N91]
MKNPGKRPGRHHVMAVLADARPDALDPSRLTDPTRQRQNLARIVAEPADSHSARRRIGFRPLGAVALTAAAAAVVVAVGTTGEQAPADRAVAQPPGPTTPRSDKDVRVDGHIELLSAARNAETAPAKGTYWQTTTRSHYLDVAEANGQTFAVSSTSTEQWSVGVRPGTQSLMVTGLDAVIEPWSAADKARWNAAGSPRTVTVDAGRKDAGRPYALGTDRPTVMRTNVDGDIYAVGPDNVSYEDLQALPPNSGELRRHLEGLYARENSADTAGAGRDAFVLRQAGNLATMPVKPGVRAAAYRVMAELPGVRVVGNVTDPLGREGVGVEIPRTYRTPAGTTQQRLVIDPSTGAMLCDQDLLVEPSARAEAAGLKAGATLNYRATTRMSWSESQITVPKNAHS